MNIDRYWEQMASTGNWNTQAAVDALTPYKTWTTERTSDRTGKTITRRHSNRGERERAVNLLNERYTSIRNADRTRAVDVLRLGSADMSAQNLKPKSEADVVTPESTGTDTRPDFGGSADSGRNPAAGRATQDAGTAGANVDDKLQGRRRTAGGLRI